MHHLEIVTIEISFQMLPYFSQHIDAFFKQLDHVILFLSLNNTYFVPKWQNFSSKCLKRDTGFRDWALGISGSRT